MFKSTFNAVLAHALAACSMPSVMVAVRFSARSRMAAIFGCTRTILAIIRSAQSGTRLKSPSNTTMWAKSLNLRRASRPVDQSVWLPGLPPASCPVRAAAAACAHGSGVMPGGFWFAAACWPVG